MLDISTHAAGTARLSGPGNTTTKADLFSRAKDAIEAGDQSLHAAAEALALAQEDFKASQREIAEALENRSLGSIGSCDGDVKVVWAVHSVPAQGPVASGKKVFRRLNSGRLAGSTPIRRSSATRSARPNAKSKKSSPSLPR